MREGRSSPGWGKAAATEGGWKHLCPFALAFESGPLLHAYPIADTLYGAHVTKVESHRRRGRTTTGRRGGTRTQALFSASAPARYSRPWAAAAAWRRWRRREVLIRGCEDGRGCSIGLLQGMYYLVGCCDASRCSNCARAWVDERRRAVMAGWCMRTRSGRGGHGRGRRDVGVSWDGSTGE